MPKGMFGHSNRDTSLVVAEKCRMDGWPASPTRNLSPLLARKQNVTNISAFIAHYLAKDGAKAFAPLLFLLILAISYLTRPASRQCQAITTPISSSQKD
jgi:hypothetical protein